MRRGKRQRPRVRTVVILVVAAIVATELASVTIRAYNDGGAPLADANNDDSLPIARLRVPMTAALDPFYDQTLRWKSCHQHFTCTTVSEPTDWSHPSAGAISVALIKHAATGVSRGSLVIDPGGPGGSGVEFIAGGVLGAVDERVAENFDVIGLDPRGVGSSTPVTCFDDAGQDDYLYRPIAGTIGSSAWIAGTKANARRLATACRAHTGALLDHVDTISAAHDLDVIRAALGEKKLNYLGYSYGSYLGTVYAGLYPSNVGRFVFDGIDDPWSGEDDSDMSGGSLDDDVDSDGSVQQAVSFENSLDAYLAACVDESAVAVGTSFCPFSGQLAGAKRAVSKIFASVDAAPLVNSDGRRLNGATLSIATIEPLYSQDDWPELTTMFRQLQKGEPRRAFELADEYNERSPSGRYYNNSSTALLAIGCLEGGSYVDLDYDRAELSALRHAAPILGQYFSYGDLVCSGWKGDPTPFPRPITAHGAAPILLVGTTNDPATPYRDAQALANQLASGHLITYHGEGHTAYDLGDSCIDAAVDAYLLDGVVPAKDPQCR